MVKTAFGCLVWMIAGATLVVGVANYFVIGFVQVSHDAMAPTILKDEYVITWRRGVPKVGSITICERADGLGPVIGRVIAMNAERVGSWGNSLKIDNQEVRLGNPRRASFLDSMQGIVRPVTATTETLPSGESHDVLFDADEALGISIEQLDPGDAYLVSDNRAVSGQDSRTFGPVLLSSCHGTVEVRLTAKSDPGLSFVMHRALQAIE